MKRFLILGFLLVSLLTIPVILYLIRNQTQISSNAAPATQLSFIPNSKTQNVGDNFHLDINLDPGQGASANSVAFVDLQITYPTNLDLQKTASNNNTGLVIGQVNGQQIVILSGPSSTCATQSCVLKISLGMPPGNPIKGAQPIGTIYFTAKSATDPNAGGAKVTMSGSKALSVASGDKPSDNVLAGVQDATITINTAANTTPVPTDTTAPGQPTNTPVPTDTTAPGQPTNTPVPTATPTDTPVPGQPTDTPVPTDTPTPAPGAPTCSSLTASGTSGTTPVSITFTAAGTANTGNVTKVSFNFGDGNTQDVTTGGGIGTNSVSVQATHSYSQAGNFTATATLTDDGGRVSSICSQPLRISLPGGGTTSVPTSTPPIPSTGPGDTILAVGLAGVAIVIIGGIFLVGF